MSNESWGGEIRQLGPWFHNLHLADGLQTAPNHPLGDFPLSKWRQISIYIPAEMNNWNVLDIGCNAGFYSFEFAKRGANVLAIDREELFLSQAQWAADKIEYPGAVEFRNMQVYDLARYDWKFDVVLFLGVMYHLRYPFLAIDIVSRLVGKILLFQTLSMPGDEVYISGIWVYLNVIKCFGPVGRKWLLLRIGLPATKQTGGLPTTPASRP